MKCIATVKDKKTVVVRVSDATAAKLVKHGWHYVPKQTWKAAGRPK